MGKPKFDDKIVVHYYLLYYVCSTRCQSSTCEEGFPMCRDDYSNFHTVSFSQVQEMSLLLQGMVWAQGCLFFGLWLEVWTCVSGNHVRDEC
jgi:hypothetical protein